MALSKEVYGQVGTPRVYIDYHTYAEAIGYVKEYSSWQLDSEASKGFVFGLNPAKTIDYSIDMDQDTSQTMAFIARYQNYRSGADPSAPNSNPQFSRFMGTANYFGLLGHNLSFLTDVANVRLRMYNYIDGSIEDPDTEDAGMVVSSIVGDTHNLGNELGYSLYEIETPFDVDVCGSVSVWIWFNSAPVPDGQIFNLGSFTFGRFLDFPVAPDLNVSLSYDYSGIKSQKTISGEEITNINYYQSPNWGSLGEYKGFAPWTHIDTSSYDSPEDAIRYEGYSRVRRGGRRTFKVSFSYIDKTDMFPKNFEGNMSGLYNFGGEELANNQINNPGFGTETIWDQGSGWAITGNKAVATTSTSNLSQFATIDGGTEFKVTFTATNFDAGSFKIKIGTSDLGYTESETLQSAGTYDLYMTSPGTTDDSVDFIIDAVTSLTVKLDNVHAKPVITPTSEWFDHDSSIIGTFLNFTMGGQLPFIFQPDNTKQDFAICRLDKAASTAKQVAPGVYSLSMVFVETW